MWRIANDTPFAADYSWVIDGAGNRVWLVVAKAAFDIGPDGACRLAARGEPVRLCAEPHGEFGASSLRYETDLAGAKPGTDVLVLGDAIVPGGGEATAVDVTLRVGRTLHKRLRVNGDRVWEQGVLGLRMTPPRPFARMPLTWERAFGGWDRSAPRSEDHRLDDRNPVGAGFAVRREHCDGLALPNVELADQCIQSWRDRPAPAGFNAVDVAWTPRRQLAGTYDEHWQRERAPLWAKDFDPRYHQCAPADQQLPRPPEGGERIEVTGMSESGTLAFALPRVRLAFRTRLGRERVDDEGRLCTVVIEPNASRVVLAWQSALVCNRREDQLDETYIVERCEA